MARSHVIRVFAGLTGVAIISVAVQGQGALDTDGLIAIWLFDEGAGETAADSSGNGNDARFASGGGDWVGGVFGGAIEFHASGWLETVLHVPAVTEGLSIGCWVRPAPEQKPFANIMSSRQEPPQRGISFEQNNMEHNDYGVAGGAGQWMGCGNTQFHMEASEWGHLTFVRDDDGVMAHGYKNGEAFSKDQICDEDESTIEPNSMFRIGNWVLGGREYDGLVDEAFLFSRALSAAEVASIVELGWKGALEVSPEGKVETTWADLKGHAP